MSDRTLPYTLLLVRHGQSESNLVINAAKAGDDAGFTDEFMTAPDRAWHLTPTGVAQAQAAGAWIAKECFEDPPFPGIDAAYVSPFVRTCQTAGHLDLASRRGEGQRWQKNRGIRERDWGDIGAVPRTHFKEHYPLNLVRFKSDPLYWTPPGGESIADVAEHRVRDFLATLPRASWPMTSTGRVVAVTHGEFIQAARIVLEQLDDEAALDLLSDHDESVRNCEVVQYARGGSPYYSRVRRIVPVEQPDGSWEMSAGDWRVFTRVSFSSEELRATGERPAAV